MKTPKRGIRLCSPSTLKAAGEIIAIRKSSEPLLDSLSVKTYLNTLNFTCRHAVLAEYRRRYVWISRGYYRHCRATVITDFTGRTTLLSRQLCDWRLACPRSRIVFEGAAYRIREEGAETFLEKIS